MCLETIDRLVPGSRHEVKNGMGGVFIVRLLEMDQDGTWTVRVDMPRNPDWHQYLFNCVDAAQLMPLRADWA